MGIRIWLQWTSKGFPQFHNLSFNVAKGQNPKGTQEVPQSALSLLPNYWHRRTYSAVVADYLHTTYGDRADKWPSSLLGGRWGRRKVKEQFSGIAREFDRQIKEATMREAVCEWEREAEYDRMAKFGLQVIFQQHRGCGVAFACSEINLPLLLAAQGNTFCHTLAFKPGS